MFLDRIGYLRLARASRWARAKLSGVLIETVAVRIRLQGPCIRTGEVQRCVFRSFTRDRFNTAKVMIIWFTWQSKPKNHPDLKFFSNQP